MTDQNHENDQWQVKSVAVTLWITAGLKLVLEFAVLVSQLDSLENLLGWYQIISALVFLVLGFFVQQHSMVALILAIVTFGLDTLFGIALPIMVGATPAMGIECVRLLLVYLMIRTIGPMRRINRAPSAPPSTSMTP